MSIRVYVPGEWMSLRETMAIVQMPGSGLDPLWNLGPARGYAVTAALRSALPELDDEALEHYAMTEAAQASLASFHDEGEPMRRLVLAVDVDGAEPVAGSVCEVQVEIAVPHHVVAWLVDTESAAGAVGSVAGSLPLTGAESAQEVERIERAVDACLDHELAWFAATEADDVMRLA